MMATRNEVRQALTRMVTVSTEGRVPETFMAEVTAVYPSTRSCDVVSMGGTGKPETLYEGVRLMPDTDDGLLYLPTIGSTVLVAVPPNATPCVMMWSALTEIVLTGSDSILKLTEGLAQFNDGSHGGVPISSKVEDNLNELKDYIKNVLEPGIITALTAIGSGGAASGAAGAANFNLNVVPQQIPLVDVANDKVKH